MIPVFSCFVNRIKEQSAKIGSVLIDILFPQLPPCPLCGGGVSGVVGEVRFGRTGLCQTCLSQIQNGINGMKSCANCGKFMVLPTNQHVDHRGANRGKESILCNDCHEESPNYFKGWSVGAYEGILRDAVFRLKYGGERSLAKPLGRLMAERLWNELNSIEPSFPWGKIQKPILVPIPLHPDKLYQRNFNQAELLALEVAKETGFPVLPELLKRVKNTPTQAGLTKRERKENVQGMFAVNIESASKIAASKFKIIVLLDDIYTTGATVQEAVKTLREGFAEKEILYCFLSLCTGIQTETAKD